MLVEFALREQQDQQKSGKGRMRRKLALGYIPALAWWPGKGTGTSGKHPPNAAKGSYCFCEEEGNGERRVGIFY